MQIMLGNPVQLCEKYHLSRSTRDERIGKGRAEGGGGDYCTERGRKSGYR